MIPAADLHDVVTGHSTSISELGFGEPTPDQRIDQRSRLPEW